MRIRIRHFILMAALAALPSVPSQSTATRTHCIKYSYGAVINAAISGTDFIRESQAAITKGEFSQCEEGVAIDLAAVINETVPGPTETWSSKIRINVQGIFPATGGSARYEIPPQNVQAVRQHEDGSQHPVKFSGPVVMVFSDGNANMSFFNWYDNPYFPEQTYLVRHSVVSTVRRRDQ